jgi:hypothetical protein
MFLLEINQEDIIDFAASIPQKEITDFEKLQEFFTFLSNKTPDVYGSCEGVVFQCRWNRETLGPLYDTDVDGSWDSMKTALKEEFNRGKKEQPNVKTFYIAVKVWGKEETRSTEEEGKQEVDESVW